VKKLLFDIKKFNEDRGWHHYHTPKNIAISLAMEAAEILEIFQWTKNTHKIPQKNLESLEDEMADTYYWLLMLSDKSGIDLNKALKKKMKQNHKKYPVEKIKKGVWKKYTEIK
jgi:NTP pyrophosphatase (non-canonical NTP hydrolase)